MTYTPDMQKSVIHNIAAASSLSVHPVYRQLSEVMSTVRRNYITNCLANTDLQT